MALAVRMRCAKCSARFTRPQGSRRKSCETCSPSRVKPISDPSPSGPSDIAGPIEASIRARLDAVGRAETVEGLVAVSVARDIDAGRVAPAQKARVGQQLAGLMAAATAGAESPVRDRLDELTERRAGRRASA